MQRTWWHFPASRQVLICLGFAFAMTWLVGGGGTGCGGSADPVVGASCELDTDCSSGAWCDLGACAPCAQGAGCNRRCASEPDAQATPISFVPDPSTDMVPVPTGLSATVQLQGSATMSSRFRVVTPPNVTARPAEGSFTDVQDIELTYDDGADPADPFPILTVVTAAGTLALPLQMGEPPLEGHYVASMRYESPWPLGEVRVELGLWETADGYVASFDPQATPGYWVGGESTFALTTSGDGVYTGTLFQSYATVADGLLFDHEVTRALRFEWEAGDSTMQFVETWLGVADQPVEFSGTLRLADRTELTDDPPPSPPPAPDLAPLLDAGLPQIFDESDLLFVDPLSEDRFGQYPADLQDTIDCAFAGGLDMEFVPPADPGVGIWTPLLDRCVRTPAGSPLDPAEAQLCATRAVETAVGFDRTPFLDVTAEDTIPALATRCRSELAADAPPFAHPSARLARDTVPLVMLQPYEPLKQLDPALPECFRPANAACAVRYQVERMDTPDGVWANEAFLDVWAGASETAGLLVNDAMVEAYRARGLVPLQARRDVDALVAEARAVTEPLYRWAFGPGVLPLALERLEHPDTPDPDAPRGMVAQAVLAEVDLTEEWLLTLGDRGVPAAEPYLEVLRLQGLLAVVNALYTSPGVSVPFELNGALGAVASAAERARTGQGALADEVGVVFVDDGRAESTNLEELLQAATVSEGRAIEAEEVFQSLWLQYESSSVAAATELITANAAINAELIELCGFLDGAPDQPDVEGCGELDTSGLGEARAELAIARGLVDVDLASLSRHYQQIEIAERQRDARLEVLGAQLVYVDDLDAQITDIEIRANRKSKVGGFFSVIGSFISAAITGDVGGALSSTANHYKEVQRNRANQQISELEREKSYRALVTNLDLEQIDGQARVDSLRIDLPVLMAQVVASTDRVAAALLRLDRLAATRDRLVRELITLQRINAETLAVNASVRLIRDSELRRLQRLRRGFARDVLWAARAFELEFNTPFRSDVQPVLAEGSARDVQDLLDCLRDNVTVFRARFGVPQRATRVLSVRRDLLGIEEPIQADGRTLSEAEQFQGRWFSPLSPILPGVTSPSLTFATSAEVGTGQFDALVCNAHTREIRIQLVGDGLGDAEAAVLLQHAGSSFVRGCEDPTGATVRQFDLRADVALVAAGINRLPEQPNLELASRPVWASNWSLVIPRGNLSPVNADLDVTQIEDILIEFTYDAITLSDGVPAIDPVCLDQL